MRLMSLIALSCGACAAHSTIARVDGTAIARAEIDATVERAMRAGEVTGVGIALFDRGEPVFVRAYGVRDTARHLPLTPDSVMTAASLSKAAFAYLVMKLVDLGKLELDKPLETYLRKPLSEFPRYADLAGDARTGKLTVRILLDHTSGFANWRWFEDDRRLAFHFEPGSRFAYSGEGIALLQLVVEEVMHAPLDRLMADRVFGPLGMTHTSMVWQERFEADHAIGYDEYGRPLGPQRRRQPDAAGGMQTTLADYARFLAAVMQPRGLTRAARDEMLRPQIRIDSLHQFPTLASETTTSNRAIDLAYGLGWGVYHTAHGRAFFKEGHDDGWRHYAVGFDSGRGLLIMTNSSNGEGIFQELIETLLGNRDTPVEWEGFTPYAKQPPRKPLPIHHVLTLAPAVLDRYVGRYLLRDEIITIRRSGDHLALDEVDKDPEELIAEGERDFFSTASDQTFTFVVDADGSVTAMIAHVGKDLELRRLP